MVVGSHVSVRESPCLFVSVCLRLRVRLCAGSSLSVSVCTRMCVCVRVCGCMYVPACVCVGVHPPCLGAMGLLRALCVNAYRA